MPRRAHPLHQSLIEPYRTDLAPACATAASVTAIKTTKTARLSRLSRRFARLSSHFFKRLLKFLSYKSTTYSLQAGKQAFYPHVGARLHACERACRQAGGRPLRPAHARPGPLAPAYAKKVCGDKHLVQAGAPKNACLSACLACFACLTGFPLAFAALEPCP